MARSAILVLLAFFIVSTGQSQRQGTSSYLKKYHHALDLYNSQRASEYSDSIALRIFLDVAAYFEEHPGQDSILFNCYMNAAILEMSAKEERLAIAHFFHAANLKNQNSYWSDSLLFQPYLFIGNSYYELNDLDSALYWYRQAESLNQRYPQLEGSERLFNKIGALYYETGDYKKSIQYFRKALSQIQGQKHPNLYFVVNYENNIASALRKLRQNEEALKIYKSLLVYGINKNELLHNVAVTYLNTGKSREAIDYLLQVQNKNRIWYNDIGHAYLQLRKFDSARHFLQKAIVALPALTKGIKNLDYGITLKYLGDLSVAEGRMAEGLSFYQQSIIQIDYDYKDTALQHNPSSFQGLHNSFFLFDALTSKAEAYHQLYKLNASRAFLVSSFDAYMSAIRLARHVEKSYNSDEARLFLASSAVEANRKVIGISLQLYELTNQNVWINQAFALMESSKASVLLAGSQQISLETISGLPQDLIREERNYKMNIARLNLEVSNMTDQQDIEAVQKRLTDIEIKLSAVQSKMDDNPRYQNLKFDLSDLSIGKVQSLINTNSALISYYFLEGRLIIFFITNEHYGYQAVKIDSNLTERIFELRDLLRQNKRERNKENEIGTYLFDQLIAPILEKIRQKDHLIVIPHNEISYIPFELLIDKRTEDILLKSFSISYQYSANFLSNPAEQRDQQPEYSVLALAPFAMSTSDESFPLLPLSKNEITGLKGLILMDSSATKKHFIESMPFYPVIHLATHAVANDSDPLQSYIAFFSYSHSADSIRLLYEQEIYNLDMQSARLIILSACETGNGQLINNEGIMSLSRAFSYAGCKSVITSLWKADDLSTAYIGNRMHYYLSHGFRKDEALRKAKLDFMDDSNVDPSHKTPSSWAHLILIGNAEAITKIDHRYIWLWIVVGLILIGLAWEIFKKAGHKV